MSSRTKMGICPMCGSNIDYLDSNIFDEQLSYDFICNECNSKGKEWYHLEYLETKLDKNVPYDVTEIEDSIDEIFQNNDNESVVRDKIVSLVVQLSDYAYKMGSR